MKKSYTWGLDLTGSLTASGGVGALLQIHDYNGGGKTLLPSYDGNGNVVALVDAEAGSLSVEAAYEYSAFGESVRAEGSYAASNRFRFSTKDTDAESGLVNFGMRHYSLGLGRFLNRDPISESGGLNLYGFVGNDAVNRWDYLGLNVMEMDGSGGVDPGASKAAGGSSLVNKLYTLAHTVGVGGADSAMIDFANRSDPDAAVGSQIAIRAPDGSVRIITVTPDMVYSNAPISDLNSMGNQIAGPMSVSLGSTLTPMIPNRGARDDLIRQAGVITRRMNETLSDMNVIERNIVFGEAVSTAHMVLNEGISVSMVVGKGVSVLKNVLTLGGVLVRGPGTLGVGGRVVGGVPGTAAGDIINASIRDQQIRGVVGAVGREAASTFVGGIIVNEAARWSYEFQDALGSGRGAVDAAYSAAGALQRTYYQDAARLKAIREEIARLGPPGGG